MMSRRLPVELLHLIITYLTEKEYGPILKFRTVCRAFYCLVGRDISDLSTKNVWRNFLFKREREFLFHIDEDIIDIKKDYSTILITKNRFIQLHSQSEIISPIHPEPQTLQLAYDVSQRFLEKIESYI